MGDRYLANLAMAMMAYQEKMGNDDISYGIKQYLREEYGLSADKSRYILDAAWDLRAGNNPTFKDEPVPSDEGDTISASFSGPIRTTKDLAALLGIDEAKFDLVGGTAKAWGKANNQNISVAADFKPRVYPALADSDREALRQDLAKYSPIWEEPVFVPTLRARDDTKMLEIFITDLHVGQVTDIRETGASINTEKSLDRLTAAIEDALAQSAGQDLAEINLVLNGDSLDVDNGRYTTTAGTQQFNDTSWQSSFRSLRLALVRGIDRLSQHSPRVNVYILPGNHDNERAFYLADVLWAWYNNNRAVYVDIGLSPRKYIEWGSNLIGLAHGHNEKPEDLAMLIMRENQHRLVGVKTFEWHLGHVHHQVSKEFQGVLLRWFRSLSENNAWAARKGFGNNPRSSTAMLWHNTKGLVAEYHYVAES